MLLVTIISFCFLAIVVNIIKDGNEIYEKTLLAI